MDIGSVFNYVSADFESSVPFDNHGYLHYSNEFSSSYKNTKRSFLRKKLHWTYETIVTVYNIQDRYITWFWELHSNTYSDLRQCISISQVIHAIYETWMCYLHITWTIWFGCYLANVRTNSVLPFAQTWENNHCIIFSGFRSVLWTVNFSAIHSVTMQPTLLKKLMEIGNRLKN